MRFGRPDDWESRLPAVLQILYLVFNEGYTATSGATLQRADLAVEAIRLTRTVHRLLPGDPEVAGLLALMLLTDARRAARQDARGELVPLDEQDRGRWDRAAVAEGVELVTRALVGSRGTGRAGPYQVRAAVAAVHDEADSYDATDWREILGLYDVLVELVPGPVERLNRVVAVAMVRGRGPGSPSWRRWGRSRRGSGIGWRRCGGICWSGRGSGRMRGPRTSRLRVGR